MLRRAVATLCAGLMATTPALACTDVRLIAGDGSAMTVRTMEFAMDLDSEVQIIPRGQQVTSPAPKGDGLK
jgi:choloylglycine hydrolase